MKTGIVNAKLEGVIRLTVLGPTGQRRTISAVIDTGFDGWLSLPPALVVTLQLQWQQLCFAILADGSQILVNVYDATVIWDRKRLRISADEAATTPLVGMALLEDHELKIQVRKRGKVTIRPLR